MALSGLPDTRQPTRRMAFIFGSIICQNVILCIQNKEKTVCESQLYKSPEPVFFPKLFIRRTGKELGANPVRVFMSGDLGGKQSHAFPLKTIQMH